MRIATDSFVKEKNKLLKILQRTQQVNENSANKNNKLLQSLLIQITNYWLMRKISESLPEWSKDELLEYEDLRLVLSRGVEPVYKITMISVKKKW